MRGSGEGFDNDGINSQCVLSRGFLHIRRHKDLPKNISVNVSNQHGPHFGLCAMLDTVVVSGL